MMSEAEFAAEYEKGFGAVLRFLCRKGVWRDEAEDLAQAAWARAWEKRGSFRGDCAFLSWVTKISLNLLRRDIRKQRVRERSVPDFPTSYSVDMVALLDVELVLSRLSVRNASLLRMRYIQGLEFEDMGANSKIQMYRARKQARERTFLV